MSTLTPEEMELFGMAPPRAAAPATVVPSGEPADIPVPTRCDAGHSAGLRAPGTRVAIADCERCQELGIGAPDAEPAAVLPPDAPASDPATPAPVKRGRKPKPEPVAAPAPVYVDAPNLRDQFALSALNGLLASGVPQNETLASRAFAIADAMIAAR